jgi:two-component system sensor histidine kinase DegS
MRPPTLDTLGFVPALRRYVQDFNQYAAFSCHMTIDGNIVRLLERVEVNIYRLFQEALQNIYAHAQAQEVTVKIRFSPQQLFLLVKDDGVGFDWEELQRNNRHRFGLITMQERAKNMSGQLMIVTHPGEGTQIQLTIPLDESSES